MRMGQAMTSMGRLWFSVVCLMAGAASTALADNPPPRTTLSSPDVKYTIPESGYAVLRRGPVEAVIVDNRAVDDAVLPGHKAGYHGVASLKHTQTNRNLFVPSYSGLNLEHIHDGTTQPRELLFEPRNVPMQLRRLNEFTAELYQAPMPHWGLESCLRYELLESGVIEMTFECVPHKDAFKNGYVGLFWASYINHPESKEIQYPGHAKDAPAGKNPEWIRGVTPRHGELATHVAVDDQRQFAHAADFPLTLVFNESASRFTEPWYFGRNGQQVLLQAFRRQDGVRFSQSPSGGGDGCPAWDFQWFIPDYKVGQRYQLVMRAASFVPSSNDEASTRDQALNVARAAQLGLGDPVAKVRATTPGRSPWERLKKGGTVVCLGDSVTGVYYHTGGQRAYTDMLGYALRKVAPGSDFKMINAGISGHSTVNGLERLERDVLQHRPDLVTVMFGLNDMVRVPPEQYRANLITIVRRCWEVGADVMLCTPNNVINTGGRPIEKLEVYCDIIREVGRTLGVPVADVYAHLEELRKQDADAWRCLLSDEIHPNMDGHKRMAEAIAKAITGQAVSVAEVEPPPVSLAGIAIAVKTGRPVKVIAMPPFDGDIKRILEKQHPGAKFEITTWEVKNQTLSQLEKEANSRVRALKPDLVVIAVPRSAKFNSREELIHSYSWIMNWSLSFGLKEWECLVIHPAVADPADPDVEYDAFVRKIVRAQDLRLIDRQPNDQRPAIEILSESLNAP